MPHSDPKHIWRALRRVGQNERRELIAGLAPGSLSHEEHAVLLELADLMVESSVSFFGMPLGIATNFVINNKPYCIPMATEEPSVIAAASYGAGLISQGGGLTASADEPVMTAQVFLRGVQEADIRDLADLDVSMRALVEKALPNLEKRGGGYRGMDTVLLPETGVVRVHLYIHVCDVMGANMLNTAAEQAARWLEEKTGADCIMAILSNSAEQRLARAEFRVPVKVLRHEAQSGARIAERMVLAAAIAREDQHRAVTHNKGIMNGITALALATGNDTRGIEAAVHRFASAGGAYTALSRYHVEGDHLCGSIELPLPMAVAGGAVGTHPCARFALDILGHPHARELACIGASLGLAQNFAALRALVSEGIQQGHMKLHARRIAYSAGARGHVIEEVAERIWQDNDISIRHAAAILAKMNAEW